MRFVWTTIVLSAISLASRAWAEPYIHDGTFTPDQVLRVTAQNISINCESRFSVVINGTSPGPPLYLVEGKPQWIRVYNDIVDQNVTVHWHGLAQRAAPFSDGTPLVSQWPIPPLHFFDYEIYPDSAGTFFYHSHVGFQSVSAHGPLIIKDRCPPKDAPQYDEDISLMVADYFNKTDEQIETGLLGNPFQWSGETNAILINDKSGTSFKSGPDASCAPYVLKVKPDTKYRVRLIGGTALSLVTLGIENHTNLTIIEADGTASKPHDTDHIQIASGQRFSIVLNTKTAAELQALNKTSFWIRYENRERPANISGYALLSYDIPSAAPLPTALPTTSPVTLPAKIYDWLEYALTPADPNKSIFPTKSDRTVTIQTHQYGSQNATTGAFISKLEWGQNGNIWQVDRVPVPYLVDFYLRGAAAVPDYAAAQANGGWDPKNLAFPAKVGEVVDIVWESNNLPTGGWDVCILPLENSS
jgi:L-ascorbate oxidase